MVKLLNIDHMTLYTLVHLNVWKHTLQTSHTHNCIEIFYVLQGSAISVRKFPNGSEKKDVISVGDYCVIDIGTYHGFEDCKADFQVMNLLFFPHFIQKHMSSSESFEKMIVNPPFDFEMSMFDLSPSLEIFHDNDREIFDIFKKAYSVYQAQSFGYLELIRCYLVEIIMRSLTPLICNVIVPKKSNNVITEICDYINIHYAEQISLTQICKDRFFSVSYISRLFKKELGMSFAAYLQETRMYNACRFLSQSSMSIENISVAVGYNNTSAFRRIFQKFMKISPSDYRKQHNTVK